MTEPTSNYSSRTIESEEKEKGEEFLATPIFLKPKLAALTQRPMEPVMELDYLQLSADFLKLA
jgi:hypothetical protein